MARCRSVRRNALLFWLGLAGLILLCKLRLSLFWRQRQAGPSTFSSPRRRCLSGLSNGTRLGPYEIIGLIGAGGMGEVYRARDSRLARHVAIKVLPSATSSDPDRQERFRREARVISGLQHPNICRRSSTSDNRMEPITWSWSTWKGKDCASNCSMGLCLCARHLITRGRSCAVSPRRTSMGSFIATLSRKISL